jgi:4-hydroxybenzoate polyprenyltransferase
MSDTTASNLITLIKISRPHFWLYEAGTYLLGILIALQYSSTDLLTALVWGVYFLIPANILIYGVNDVFDYETDLKNPKKQSYESVLPKEKHRFILIAALLINTPFIVYAYTLSVPALLALVAFLFFATFYSAPPIRAKARPFIDSVFSAGHYVATGVFGFLLLAPPTTLVWELVVAAMAWAIAMHVYSAIPDIEADQAVDLDTTATKLGHRRSVWYCTFLYSTAAILSAPATEYASLLFLIPYLVIMYRSYRLDSNNLLGLYKYFPYLNALVGGLLSMLAISRLLLV